MSLTDLLKGMYRPLVLSAFISACGGDDSPQPCTSDADCKGGRVCKEGYCGDGGASPEYDQGTNQNLLFCQDLCKVVYDQCEGLPQSNYNFGTSKDDCLNRCPSFYESVKHASTAEEVLNSLQCVVDRSTTCEDLRFDRCKLPEGDLFECFISGNHEC